MFSQILIANRGEIALRLVRACHDMGICATVVYSEADRDSPAVRLADRSVCIGPSPSEESYLSIQRILEAARETRAEALHPGYGFLSENPDLVTACQANDIVFIGPSAESIRIMGDKVTARKAVIQAGVPVVAGSRDRIRSIRDARDLALEIGYPVLLKASRGGGGKGMRLVQDVSQLERAFELTRGEAAAAFADSSLFLEKYIEHPRHIEVQVLGDRHGTLLHLGERECSIQRRYQKMVEECPSPRVTPKFRRVLGQAALDAARSVDYQSAGTVEFLIDGSSRQEIPPFFFLEMNTRLQVEHPVTEMVYGVDLVKEQIRIAAGLPISFDESPSPRGAAIECRISAEDPAADFLPSPGRITTLVEPSGPGIRCDSGVTQESTIPQDYDPLISKLAAWGRDREEAISRLRRALSEYKIGGIVTTIPFFSSLVRHPQFVEGNLSTQFLEKHDIRVRGQDMEGEHAVPLIAAALIHFMDSRPASGSTAGSTSWRVAGRQDGMRPRYWRS